MITDDWKFLPSGRLLAAAWNRFTSIGFFFFSLVRTQWLRWTNQVSIPSVYCTVPHSVGLCVGSTKLSANSVGFMNIGKRSSIWLYWLAARAARAAKNGRRSLTAQRVAGRQTRCCTHGDSTRVYVNKACMQDTADGDSTTGLNAHAKTKKTVNENTKP
jgi:hypothetical protein